jgi:uncharacterized protein (DUF1684 family)
VIIITDQATAERTLAEFRQQKDAFMGRHRQSPLDRDQRHGFRGLAYFPYDAALRLELPLDRDVSEASVQLETSTGDQQEYRRAGKIHFAVDGQPAELTIYQGEGGDLFLPLRDATSGSESYGAGRYLEPHEVDDQNVLVDFNYLYNPYCAYNDQWSCPLPPRENWLEVPIRAGEKKFHD